MILIKFVLHWSLIFAFVEMSSFAETPSGRVDSASFSSEPMACKKGLQWKVKYKTCPHPTHTPIYHSGKGGVCGVTEWHEEGAECDRVGFKECRHSSHQIETMVSFPPEKSAYNNDILPTWEARADDLERTRKFCEKWCQWADKRRHKRLNQEMLKRQPNIELGVLSGGGYTCDTVWKIPPRQNRDPGTEFMLYTCHIKMNEIKLPLFKLATSAFCPPKFDRCRVVKEERVCRRQEFGIEGFEEASGPECGIESISLFSDIKNDSIVIEGGIRFNDDVENFRKSVYATPSLRKTLKPSFAKERFTVKITEPGSDCLLCSQLKNPMDRTICLLKNLATLHDIMKFELSDSELKSKDVQSALEHINEELTFAIRELVGAPEKTFANAIGGCAKHPADFDCKHFFAQIALSASNDKKLSLLSNIGLRLLEQIGPTGNISDENNFIYKYLIKLIFGEKLFDIHTINFDLISEIRLRLKSFDPELKTSGPSKYLYASFIMSDFYARAVEKYVSQRSYEILKLKSLLAKLKSDQLSVKDVLDKVLSEINKMNLKPKLQSSVVESLMSAREGTVQEIDNILADTVALIKGDIRMTLSQAEKLLNGLAAKSKLLEGVLGYLDLINGNYNQALLKLKESRISFRQDRDLPIESQNELFEWMFANFLAILETRISESSKLFEKLKSANGPVFDLGALALGSESSISAQLLEVFFQANINFNESLNAVRLQVLGQIDDSMISSQIELKNELEKLR